MPIKGHYDRQADVVWLHSEDYDPRKVVGEETEVGLRELDPVTGAVVGLEVWQASRALPTDLLGLFPSPERAATRRLRASLRQSPGRITPRRES